MNFKEYLEQMQNAIDFNRREITRQDKKGRAILSSFKYLKSYY